ncbi:MAG: hypothetical protein GKS05_13155 [Nitrospirales bacterium]|nr:hypothetical protein [Nitrospirales bacterium]
MRYKKGEREKTIPRKIQFQIPVHVEQRIVAVRKSQLVPETFSWWILGAIEERLLREEKELEQKT